MYRWKTYSLVLIVLFSCSTAAFAASPHASVMFSPAHLTIPLVEVTCEFASAKSGLAGILGVGNKHGSTLTEIGFQYNYYCAGHFNNGMQIGVELLYSDISPYFDLNKKILFMDGLNFGMYMGYKVIFTSGATLNIQGGVNINTPYNDQTSTYTGTLYSNGTGGTYGIVALLLHTRLGWSI